MRRLIRSHPDGCLSCVPGNATGDAGCSRALGCRARATTSSPRDGRAAAAAHLLRRQPRRPRPLPGIAEAGGRLAAGSIKAGSFFFVCLTAWPAKSMHPSAGSSFGILVWAKFEEQDALKIS
uniref:Uncharacterized protein n=1 Tax=Oryza barthii TaxID=65489 RepID=A0A0D3G6S6_9ORYZ